MTQNANSMKTHNISASSKKIMQDYKSTVWLQCV